MGLSTYYYRYRNRQINLGNDHAKAALLILLINLGIWKP
jgi:hypothetical protein